MLTYIYFGGEITVNILSKRIWAQGVRLPRMSKSVFFWDGFLEAGKSKKMMMMLTSLQLGLLPMHPGPGGERGGALQEEEIQPRQRDMEVD